MACEFDIKSYEDFKNGLKVRKYFGSKCFVGWCNNMAEYEGGDNRFYCGYCEECADIKGKYRRYLKELERKIKIRMLWDKDDVTLKSLYEIVVNKLKKEI